MTAAPTSFTPPDRDDYVFGMWQPWWRLEGRADGGHSDEGSKQWSLTGATDATGAHALHMDFLSVKPALPMSVVASAEIRDVNRQAWSASSTLLVHPSSLYVGLKAKRPFVEKGTPFEVEVIGVDVDGKPAAGAVIEVRTVRIDWGVKDGDVATREVDVQSCNIAAGRAGANAGTGAGAAGTGTGATGAGAGADAVAVVTAKPKEKATWVCSFATTEGGEYRVTATIVDGKGRPSETRMTFWVSGGQQAPAREVAQEKVQLIPDKKVYTPGNTAELLVRAPFYPAEGVVTWRRSGIVKTEKIALDGPTKVITVPISDAMTPNVIVQVDLVGAAARLDDKGAPDASLPRRPAYAVGTIDLPVPPRQRALKVSVAPSAAKLGPGEQTQLAVAVADAQGRPVADAEVAIIAVDEAILSLTAAQFADPIDAFYPRRGAETDDYYARSYVKLARPSLDQLA
ncbi:MAG: hypothetical protein ACRDMZ_12355, partial [Solirubrobacteraceae bacterium]